MFPPLCSSGLQWNTGTCTYHFMCSFLCGCSRISSLNFYLSKWFSCTCTCLSHVDITLLRDSKCATHTYSTELPHTCTWHVALLYPTAKTFLHLCRSGLQWTHVHMYTAHTCTCIFLIAHSIETFPSFVQFKLTVKYRYTYTWTCTRHAYYLCCCSRISSLSTCTYARDFHVRVFPMLT